MLVIADGGAELIGWVIFIAIVVIINGVSAFLKKLRAEQTRHPGQRPTHGSAVHPAASGMPRGAAKNDDLAAFLASVRKAAAKQQQRVERPAPRPAAHMPRTAQAASRPTPRPPQPRRKVEEPIVIQPTVISSPLHAAPAESAVPQPPAAPHQPETGWLNKLPQGTLKRAIILQTVLGAPASRRNAPNGGPIALRR